jgi:glycerol-3-phosphate acyltransferase PlsX
VFLGHNGLVVKSHGGATELGVATAIGAAAKMVRDRLTERIINDLGNIKEAAAA